MSPKPNHLDGGDREIVPPGCACPQCHENDMDRLVWIDDETVECQTCRTQYEPAGTKPTE